MNARVVHECGCADSQAGEHPNRKDHRQLNVRLSRLMSSSVAGLQRERLYGWGMAVFNGSRSSPTSIGKQSDVVETNYEIDRFI